MKNLHLLTCVEQVNHCPRSTYHPSHPPDQATSQPHLFSALPTRRTARPRNHRHPTTYARLPLRCHAPPVHERLQLPSLPPLYHIGPRPDAQLPLRHPAHVTAGDDNSDTKTQIGKGSGRRDAARRGPPRGGRGVARAGELGRTTAKTGMCPRLRRGSGRVRGSVQQLAGEAARAGGIISGVKRKGRSSQTRWREWRLELLLPYL